MSNCDDLPQDFHRAMVAVYDNALQQCRYRATVFRMMVEEHGGVETAKRLLHSTTTKYGFEKLWECRCLTLTMEYQVIKPRWAPLFTKEEIATARQRLLDHGMEL